MKSANDNVNVNAVSSSVSGSANSGHATGFLQFPPGLELPEPTLLPPGLGFSEPTLQPDSLYNLIELLVENQFLNTILTEIQQAMKCYHSQKLAILPRVLGTCGHVVSEDYLTVMDNHIFTQEESSSQAKGRRELLDRKCPCYNPIIGTGFPVLALNKIGLILQNAGFKHHNVINKKENKEDTYLTALRLAYYAQTQLAQLSVTEVIAEITQEDWKTGVYIMFEPAVSRAFFEIFATTLYGKAGGVNVLVNPAQRLLAVRLPPKEKNSATQTKAKASTVTSATTEAVKSTVAHLLVKVATNGRFTVETSTLNAETTPKAETISAAAKAAVIYTTSVHTPASVTEYTTPRMAASILAAQLALAPMRAQPKVDTRLPLPRTATNTLAILSASAAPIWNINTISILDNMFNVEVKITREKLAKQNEILKTSLEKIKAELECPICQKSARLPKVLSSCGHIVCEKCLEQQSNHTLNTLINNKAGASSRQYLLARRCPLCRHEIIGAGFPVLPLRDIAVTLFRYGYIKSDTAVSEAQFTVPNYAKEKNEDKHLAAVQIASYAQSKIAQHTASAVIAAMIKKQWKTDVYIWFEAEISSIFLETFVVTLHSKAGGVNVLIDAPRRILKIPLREKNDILKPEEIKFDILIRVKTDGKFTITSRTPQFVSDLTQSEKLSEENKKLIEIQQRLKRRAEQPIEGEEHQTFKKLKPNESGVTSASALLPSASGSGSSISASNPTNESNAQQVILESGKGPDDKASSGYKL